MQSKTIFVCCFFVHFFFFFFLFVSFSLFRVDPLMEFLAQIYTSTIIEPLAQTGSPFISFFFFFFIIFFIFFLFSSIPLYVFTRCVVAPFIHFIHSKQADSSHCFRRAVLCMCCKLNGWMDCRLYLYIFMSHFALIAFF